MAEHVTLHRKASSKTLNLSAVQSSFVVGLGPVLCSSYKVITAYSKVTAIGGTTPVFTAKLQATMDGLTWDDINTLTAQSAIGFQRAASIDISGYQQAQIVYTLTGTSPTATVSLFMQTAQL